MPSKAPPGVVLGGTEFGEHPHAGQVQFSISHLFSWSLSVTIQTTTSLRVTHDFRDSRLRVKVFRMAALATLLMAAGCGNFFGSRCGAVAYLALLVTARDSLTGVLVPNAVLGVEGQGPGVSIGSNVNLYPVNLADHAGTYTVFVQVPGYLSWTKTVIVTGGCAPNSVSVTALMQKSS